MSSMVLMQAYLRLARVNVAAEECVNASTSPSSMPALLAVLPNLSLLEVHGLGPSVPACAGHLPALEHGIDIVEGARDEDASAEAIIAYLKQQGHDLDSGLSASQVEILRSLEHTFTASNYSCLGS